MRLVFRLLLILLLGVFAKPSIAATKAWLIGGSIAVKLNVSTNVIEQQSGVSANGKNNFYDSRTGNLFTLNSTRDETKIYVYDVKSLVRKGDLGLVVTTEPSDVQLLFPPSGNTFYLRRVREDDKPEITVFDTACPISGPLDPCKKHKAARRKGVTIIGMSFYREIVDDNELEKRNGGLMMLFIDATLLSSQWNDES